MINQKNNISKALDFCNNYDIIIQETKKDNIGLLDGDIFLYAICFPKKQTEEEIKLMGNQLDRSLNDVINELNNYLIDTLITTNCRYYKGFLSGKSFRKDIATIKEYKGNRTQEKPKYFNEIKQYLIEQWGFYQDNELRYEADDLIASWNKVYMLKEWNPIIITIDKDMDQLAGTHYNPRKKELYSISEGQANYLLWHQVITGDPTDSIKGIEGIGKIGASKILQNKIDHEYKLATIEAYISKYDLKNGINNFTENFNLVYLCNDYLDKIKMSEQSLHNDLKTVIDNINTIKEVEI
jgi:5'-3' exonuclease